MSGSRDSYLDLENNNVGRRHPDVSLSSFRMNSTKKAVRTFIGSGKSEVIDDDGIHLEIALQQHSRKYDSP